MKAPVWKIAVPIVLIVGAVIGGLFALQALVPSRQPPAPGQFILKQGAVAPDFSLSSPKGEKTPFSQIKGKVFLVNFWATWCEACMVEMPSISKLREEYHGRGFEVLGVNLDENPEIAFSIARERLGVQFPLFVDSENRLSDLFDVHGIPLTIVLDRARKVLLVETGERDWFDQDMRKRVEGWLSNE